MFHCTYNYRGDIAMNLIEKLKLYCSINETGRVSDTDFKGLVREAMGLTNKKRVSVTAKVRTKNYSETESYRLWLDKYFPNEKTIELELEKDSVKKIEIIKEEEQPIKTIDKKDTTEVTEDYEQRYLTKILHKDDKSKKPIVY